MDGEVIYGTTPLGRQKYELVIGFDAQLGSQTPSTAVTVRTTLFMIVLCLPNPAEEE